MAGAQLFEPSLLLCWVSISGNLKPRATARNWTQELCCYASILTEKWNAHPLDVYYSIQCWLSKSYTFSKLFHLYSTIFLNDILHLYSLKNFFLYFHLTTSTPLFSLMLLMWSFFSNFPAQMKRKMDQIHVSDYWTIGCFISLCWTFI